MAMDDPRQAQTLDIPHGTTFEFKDGKLVFGHESDIVIRTNLGGHKFQKIFSKRGSVQVMPPPGVEFDVDEIEAMGGDVFLNGRVRVRSVRAKTIHFQEGTLVADKLEATAECVLGGEKLDVLHVKAPRVLVEGEATGTCLVIESGNDVGRLRVKGGFRTLEEARDAWERFQRATGARPKAPAAADTTSPFGVGSLPAPTPSVPRVAATLPAPEPRDPADTAAIPVQRERDRSLNMTEEFHAPFGPSSEGGEGGSALPKSSVFRKRK